MGTSYSATVRIIDTDATNTMIAYYSITGDNFELFGFSIRCNSQIASSNVNT